MLKPKKRITKRELKEDKFVLYTIKAKDFIESHAKLLIQIGVGVLIVIILVSFYVRSKRTASVEANALLGEAQLVMNQGNTDKAQELLQQLATDYEGVTAAGQGTFLLAKLYWKQDDCENATLYFKKYFDEYGNDDLLTSGAYAGYADCLLEEGKVQEAAENYEKAANVKKNLPLAASYLFSAAQAYQQLENWSKVKQLTGEIIENYSDSQYKTQAEILQNMAKLKA